MRKVFNRFLISKLYPLFEKEFGLQPGRKCVFKVLGSSGVALYLELEPWHFNVPSGTEPWRIYYPNNYGFNILLNLVGLKQGAKLLSNISRMVEDGNHPISAVDIKVINGKPPSPYYLTEINEEQIISDIWADITSESVKKWMTIHSTADLDAMYITPENRHYIYNYAYYLAISGSIEKSRRYFMMIKNQGNIIHEVAASFGIDLE